MNSSGTFLGHNWHTWTLPKRCRDLNWETYRLKPMGLLLGSGLGSKSRRGRDLAS